MLQLSPTDLARIKQLTTECYPHLHPVVREYLNEQLLEAQAYWEVADWLERLELTRQFYDENSNLVTAHLINGNWVIQK